MLYPSTLVFAAQKQFLGSSMYYQCLGFFEEQKEGDPYLLAILHGEPKAILYKTPYDIRYSEAATQVHSEPVHAKCIEK